MTSKSLTCLIMDECRLRVINTIIAECRNLVQVSMRGVPFRPPRRCKGKRSWRLLDRSAWPPTTPVSHAGQFRNTRQKATLWVFQVYRRRSICGKHCRWRRSAWFQRLYAITVKCDSAQDWQVNRFVTGISRCLIWSNPIWLLWGAIKWCGLLRQKYRSIQATQLKLQNFCRHRDTILSDLWVSSTGDFRFARSTTVVCCWRYFGQVNGSYVAMFIWEVCIVLGQ